MSLINKRSLDQLKAVYKKSKKTEPKLNMQGYPNGYIEKSALNHPIQTYEDWMKTKT